MERNTKEEIAYVTAEIEKNLLELCVEQEEMVSTGILRDGLIRKLARVLGDSHIPSKIDMIRGLVDRAAVRRIVSQG